MTRNFKFFPANVAIGSTSDGERVYATPELLKALEIVKNALDTLDTPTIQQQQEIALTDFPALQAQTVAEPLPAIIAPQQVPTSAWPIGSVFFSAVSTDPSALLGFGVWTQIGAGRFPVGYLAGDPDFGTLGGTGGAKTKAISAHSGSAVANHTTTTFNAGAGATPVLTSVSAHTVTQPDNHTDLNVLPPYLVLNIWQRTA